ncbi:hypothetical protein [Clostridium gasigenes]|uniref:hypothetical protein n=1 Tax=Clostridium gasigenes TaxID=94869 RepID=UPI001C0DAE99|nr:hypothetical protein [Clostridium gasigenes]MBU3109900.1 hypothetical protein [Clostridium gasigenes]
MEITNMNNIQMINKINEHETDIVSIDTQFEENIVNVEKYSGLVVNNDWSIAFQYAIDNATDGSTIKAKANKVYTFKTPIYLKNNLKLDLNNSTIRWEGGIGINNSDGLTGMINAFGKYVDTAININNFVNMDLSLYGIFCSKLTLINVSSFVVGDHVVINLETGVQNTTSINPKVFVITKILAIIGNNIYVDYQNPFDFTGKTLSNATIQKVIPIKNVEIKNINIYDAFSYPYSSNVYTDANPIEKLKMVNGISVFLGVNIEVKNIRGENTKLKLVKFSGIYNGLIDDVDLYRPNIVGAGEGYCVQISTSTRVDAKNINGNLTRHNLDITASSLCSFENIYGYDCLHTFISLHGWYEHDLNFKCCYGGNVSMAHGLSTFGDANKNVVFDMFSFKLSSSDYTENLIFKNGLIQILNCDFNTVNFENCSVYVTRCLNNVIQPLSGTTRATNNKFILINSKLINFMSDYILNITNQTLEISNFDTFSLIDSTYELYNSNKAIQYAKIVNVKNLIFDNSILDNLITEIVSNGITQKILVRGCEFINYGDFTKSIFNFDSITNTKLDFKLCESRFNYDGLNNIVNVIRSIQESYVNSRLYFIVSNNTIIADTANKIVFNISKIATTSFIATGNIFEKVLIQGYTQTDIQNNLFI